MLSFTHHAKKTPITHYNDNFQPLVITNHLPKQASLQKQTKKIVKTLNNPITKSQPKPKPISAQPKSEVRKPWNDGGNIQMFDNKLEKNCLAAEERRLRAQSRKQKDRQLLTNEHQIKEKQLDLKKQKDKQINNIKREIQRQRRQQQKNNIQYENKKKQIQKQRQRLIEAQRRIQREGVKVLKQIERKQVKIESHEKEPTQSELLVEEQELRRHKLDLLKAERDKIRMNTNYNSTVIPLLSRASYKIISTHVSQVVELLVDDLLIEQVLLLEQIEMKQQLQKERKKEKNLLYEYYQNLNEFVNDVEQIQNKVGRYNAMKFQDLYQPKHYPLQYKPSFQYNQALIKEYILTMEHNVQQIIYHKDKFKRMISSLNQYNSDHLRMFKDLTQELIQDSLCKLAQEIDRGGSDFVDLLFHNQLN